MITKKEFYFIRHGQTDYNVSLTKVDHEDIPLNTTGRLQAQTVEPIIASLPIKSVCCSPLRRAKETKEMISTRLQATHYELADLGECSLSIWQKMTAFHHTQHEVQAFMERVVQGINHALSLEGPVLVVAHGGIHWAICSFMDITDHDWIIDNCRPVHFSLDSSGKWQAKQLLY